MQMPRMRFRMLCVAIVVLFLTWMFRHYQLDDSLIYARYIRNALMGRGLVYNAGEHVNALTSPLFSALMLLTAWLLHGHVILAENVLYCAFFLSACVLAEMLVPLSGLLIASTAYFYTLVGMETSLFLFLLILAVALYLQEKDKWLPLVAVLLFLTRAEGLAMVLVLAVLMTRERRFPPRLFLLPPGLLIGAYLVFNRVYYGSLLPSSGAAKLGQARSGYWGPWPSAFLRVPAAFYDRFRYSYYVIPLILVMAAWGIWKYHREPISRVLLPFGLLLGSFYVLLNIPDYQWYYAPFVFFLMLYAVLAVPDRKLAHLAVTLVIVQCLLGSMSRGKHLELVGPYRDAALWLAQNTPKDARVACIETGTIGWYSDRYIYDMVGLTTPRNAVHIEHRDLNSWLAEDKPDYVVMHPVQSFGERAALDSPDYYALPRHFGPIYLLKRKSVAQAGLR